ncbi:putative quinol monooxygenase [Paraburkholderia atlantica]|uniref:putative quinol monooxygenase n=1 Tax=Paraburkholderia TaxID=1822464 RepID=UPI000399E68F|nr:putative quinol monooxygenase [Paraburkholderia atlantica]
MSEVSVVAISIAKPGCEERLKAALEGLVNPVRNEAGALQYDLHQDRNDGRRFVVIERWANDTAFQAHVAAPHIEAYRKLASDWLEHAEFFALDHVR